MNFINQDINNVEGMTSGSPGNWKCVYSFPHNLTEEQRASIDLKQLADAVKEVEPSGVTFKDISAIWSQQRDMNSRKVKMVDDVTVFVTSTDKISLAAKEDMMRNMEASVLNQLSKNMKQTVGVRKDLADGVVKEMPAVQNESEEDVKTEPVVRQVDDDDNTYRVFAGKTPITMPIADKKRADFAFNMISLMDDRGVDWQKDGKDIELADLRLVDKNGNEVEPELDREWYDNDFYKNNPVREAVLDQIVADIQADLDEEGITDVKPDRAFESELMDEYTVCSYDEDRCRVRFAPHTWDIDKAGEMQNLITYGMEPSIDMYFEGRIVSGDIFVINSDGDVYEDHLNENWTKEIVDDGQSFADALASIPMDGQGLEQ